MTVLQHLLNRHVFTYMLGGMIFLFGVISYQRINIDRFPQVELPIISITTHLPGGDPTVVDNSISYIIEKSVNSIAGIEHVQSTASSGAAVTFITFDLDKDIDVAFNEVQAKINQILRELPKEAEPPIVTKVDMGANPIVWLSLHGDRTAQQLDDFARESLRKNFENINGVGQVIIAGGRERQIRINLSLSKLAQYQLSPQKILEVLQKNHVKSPGGFLIEPQGKEYLIKLDLEYHTIDDLKQSIIGFKNQAPIYLKDIATVIDGLEDKRKYASFDGKETIGIGIIKIPTSNTHQVIKSVKEKLDLFILPTLPSGIKLEIATDDSHFIKDMFQNLSEHILLGTLLAAIIVMIFLNNIRSTLIIATAIPISLFGAIIMMYFCGLTFNIMTLLGLLLLVGIVVDDAIVVLESIFRQLKIDHFSRKESAIKGLSQVFFAVLATTASLLCIFIPVIFLGGIVGRFFTSFAVVVSSGILISWLVSVVITPTLCARFMKIDRSSSSTIENVSQYLSKLEIHYKTFLFWSLHHRKRCLLIVAIIVTCSFYFLSAVGKEFLPKEDTNRFLILFKAPLGSNIDYTISKLKKIELVLNHHENIKHYFSTIGLEQTRQVNEGRIMVILTDKSSRKESQTTIMETLRQKIRGIPGIQASLAPESIVSGDRGEPVKFAIIGPDLEQVNQSAKTLYTMLNSHPSFSYVDLDNAGYRPLLKGDLDRNQLAKSLFTASDIATSLYILTGGLQVAKFNHQASQNHRIPIVLKADAYELSEPSHLKSIYLYNQQNKAYRIDQLIDFSLIVESSIIQRFDFQYTKQFFCTPSTTLGEAMSLIREIEKEHLPNGYRIKFLGQAEEFSKTTSYMIFAFTVALILLYMVLASQFNSFIQPGIVLISQPLAMVGGVFALWLFGQTLNIYSMIGMVLLIGLVAKNSILLIDLINLHRIHQPLLDAICSACPIRLRPILMTSLTIICALLPAALGFGAGAESNQPMAIAIIGGMLSSTALTLFIIPVIYSLVIKYEKSSVMSE